MFLFERMGEKIECEGSVVDKDQRDKENKILRPNRARGDDVNSHTSGISL